jgi:nickel-dependent lactate racemase
MDFIQFIYFLSSVSLTACGVAIRVFVNFKVANAVRTHKDAIITIIFMRRGAKKNDHAKYISLVGAGRVETQNDLERKLTSESVSQNCIMHFSRDARSAP